MSEYRGDSDTEENEKLADIRSLFEDAVDHTSDSHTEAHRAERFYHNSDCEGQWDDDDLAYLREQMRPAFTFNVIKPKVDTFMGMYADAQRVPEIAAASGKADDVLMAKVLNIVKDQTMEEAEHERLSSRQFKTGTIAGECGLQVEITDDPGGLDWIKINLHRVMPFEMHWDIGSIEPDRQDARYVFWDRWMSRGEFKQEYPDFAKEWTRLRGRSDDANAEAGLSGSIGSEMGAGSFDDDRLFDDNDQGARFNRYYYDRRKNRIRVIRYEYKTFEEIHYLIDTTTGQEQSIDKGKVEQAEHAITLGAEYELASRTEEITKVCEFVGMQILAEYDNAGPFKGFSIVDYCYDVDEETGTAYGLVRNLFDPQMELNKAKSLEVEYMAQSAAPGIIAEEGSVPNVDAFGEQLRTAGGVAIVNKNSLTEGRIIPDRPVTPPSAMIATRMDGAMRLLDAVSTIPQATNLSAAEHNQSGVHAALRFNKSRQSVADPFANYEASQTRVVDLVVQAIVQAMPDDQIEMILSGDGTYEVENGVVSEMVEVSPEMQQQQQQQGPLGGMGQQMPQQGLLGGMGQQMPQQQGPQMVPKTQVELRGVRNLRYNLDMEYTSENNTLRMTQLEILFGIETVKPGMVDPDVMMELAAPSRSMRERLKAYVEETKQAQAAGQSASSDAMREQSQQYAQIESSKVQESQRHNMAEEGLKLTDQQIKARLGTMDQYQKADDNEKERILNMAKFAYTARSVSGTTEAQYNGA